MKTILIASGIWAVLFALTAAYDGYLAESYGGEHPGGYAEHGGEHSSGYAEHGGEHPDFGHPGRHHGDGADGHGHLDHGRYDYNPYAPRNAPQGGYFGGGFD